MCVRATRMPCSPSDVIGRSALRGTRRACLASVFLGLSFFSVTPTQTFELVEWADVYVSCLNLYRYLLLVHGEQDDGTWRPAGLRARACDEGSAAPQNSVSLSVCLAWPLLLACCVVFS